MPELRDKIFPRRGPERTPEGLVGTRDRGLDRQAALPVNLSRHRGGQPARPRGAAPADGPTCRADRERRVADPRDAEAVARPVAVVGAAPADGVLTAGVLLLRPGSDDGGDRTTGGHVGRLRMRHGEGGRRLDSAVGERKRTMTLAGVRVIGGLHENPPRAPSRPRAPGAPGPRSRATSPRRTRGSPGKAGPPLRRRRRRSNSNGAAVRHRRRRVHDFKEYI